MSNRNIILTSFRYLQNCLQLFSIDTRYTKTVNITDYYISNFVYKGSFIKNANAGSICIRNIYIQVVFIKIICIKNIYINDKNLIS